MADPILKWAGGKRQLLDDLYQRFPKDYNHYHEPMFGGGALYFALEPADGTVNDTNPRLVNFYRQVKTNHQELLEHCRSFRDPEADPDPELEYSETAANGKEIKNHYYQQRELFNKRPRGEEFDATKEAARLLYLNRTCFNGLYRENSSGEFNVPIGRYANPDWEREAEVRAAHDVLQKTDIKQGDFDYILDVAEPGDLVYFDPPYEPMSPTANFTDYSADGFGQADQERLLEVTNGLKEQGVHVILSNSGVMYDRYEEAGLYVEIEGATRAINSDASNRDEVDEIIATTVPPDERGLPPEQKVQADMEQFTKNV